MSRSVRYLALVATAWVALVTTAVTPSPYNWVAAGVSLVSILWAFWLTGVAR